MSSATMPLSGTAAGIGIGAWTLLVVSAIAVLTRLSTKWSFERVFNLDDGFAIGALVRIHPEAQLSGSMLMVDS